MNDPANQTCPFCAEAIKPAAKLCPHCRQWLTIRSFRHPVMFMLIYVVPLLLAWISLGATALLWMERIQNPKPYYSEFPNSLKILESRMNWADTRDGMRVFVTGILTNQCSIEWGSVELECRFYDTNGVMIDADHRPAYATIQAFDDSAFRASFFPACPTNDYASFKVSVSTARNTKSRF